MERIDFLKVLELTMLVTMLIGGCVSVMAQQPPARTQVQVTPQTKPSPSGSAANAAAGMRLPSGTITGFVYWQMNVFQPQANCQGLTVKIVTVTKSGMPLQLLSTTSTLTANGPMTDDSAQGTPKYMLCSYAFQNMPENVSLRALLYGAPTTASVSTPSVLQIPGGNCNSTPSSTLSFILTGGEMLCGNGAFNVNFKVTFSPSAIERSPEKSTLIPNAGGPPHGLVEQPAARNSNVSSPTSGVTGGPPLLSSASGVGSPTGGQLLQPRPVQGGMPAGANATPPTRSPPTTNMEVPGIGAGYVPKMPPMTSNPKRDASPVADAATKTEIKSKLEAQRAASSRRSASPQKVTPKPEQSDSPEVQALQKQRIFFESLRSQPSTAKDRLVSARAPNLALRPGQSPTDPKLIAPPPQSKFCPAAQIHSVNGATSNVTFTQDPAYNDYIISGCDFGSQQGQVYLSGALTSGQINLVVKQWTDTQIEAVVQPGLTGVLDGWPDLIVAPPSMSPAKFPNCRFYAQRQSVILPSIPQQYATLANVTVGDGQHGFGTMYCPGPDLSHLFPCVAYNAGPPVDGITNGVDHRNDPRNDPNQRVSNAVDRDGGQLDFDSGEDVYDFSFMAPGFEVDYPNVFWYAWTSDVCEGWASDAFPKKPGDSVGYYTEGYYRFGKKTKTKVVVDWGVDHCAWRWLGVFRVDDWYNSGYSLQVYVKGPIGIDPWTGHAVHNPITLGEKVPDPPVRMK